MLRQVTLHVNTEVFYEFTVCSAVIASISSPLGPFTSRFLPHLSHGDAGLLPIRQFDDQIRLTEQFAAAIEDRRDPDFTQQLALSMVRQRIFGILADYETRTTTTLCGRTPSSK